MENKQTAVTALFSELKLLAEGMRFSQDIESANLIDYICTREHIVLQWEKEQLIEFFMTGKDIGTSIEDAEETYNEMYCNANN